MSVWQGGYCPAGADSAHSGGETKIVTFANITFPASVGRRVYGEDHGMVSGLLHPVQQFLDPGTLTKMVQLETRGPVATLATSSTGEPVTPLTTFRLPPRPAP